MQQSKNFSFDESKNYFGKKIKSDVEETVVAVVFFEALLEKLPNFVELFFADPEWQ